MRIGLFGGTFDPIHLGHLRVAEEVCEKRQLDKLIFIPAGRPPHRRMPNVSPEHRLAMVKLAIKKNACFEVLDYEVKKAGKSYTAETLEHIKKIYSDDKLYLILGADQCLTLPKWHRSGQLLNMCRVIAMSRPGIDMIQLQKTIKPLLRNDLEKRIKMINVSKLDISSTDIRRRLGQKRSVRYLVDSHVLDYITRHELYRS